MVSHVDVYADMTTTTTTTTIDEKQRKYNRLDLFDDNAPPCAWCGATWDHLGIPSPQSNDNCMISCMIKESDDPVGLKECDIRRSPIRMMMYFEEKHVHQFIGYYSHPRDVRKRLKQIALERITQGEFVNRVLLGRHPIMTAMLERLNASLTLELVQILLEFRSDVHLCTTSRFSPNECSPLDFAANQPTTESCMVALLENRCLVDHMVDWPLGYLIRQNQSVFPKTLSTPTITTVCALITAGCDIYAPCFPPNLREMMNTQQHHSSLESCPLKTGDLITLTHCPWRSSVTDFSTNERQAFRHVRTLGESLLYPSLLYPEGTRSVINDRGIGYDGKVCLRLHTIDICQDLHGECRLTDFWIHADSEIMKSVVKVPRTDVPWLSLNLFQLWNDVDTRTTKTDRKSQEELHKRMEERQLAVDRTILKIRTTRMELCNTIQRCTDDTIPIVLCNMIALYVYRY